MKDRVDSLRRAVIFGRENGKKNIIVDLDVLSYVLGDGDQELSIDELTERFYLVRSQRDQLIAAVQKIGHIKDEAINKILFGKETIDG